MQRQVLDQHRDGVGEHLPAGGHDASPLAGGEDQDVEHGAVEQPQRVDAQVPPASEPDGVPDTGQPDLAGQANRVLLRRPQRIGRYRLLNAEPVPAGGAVARPVQAWVVGEDLQARTDDEDQQEQIEEVLHPDPDRQRGSVWAPGEAMVPGCSAMNRWTEPVLRRPLAVATATIRSTNPIGSNHSRLNHRDRPTRTRGAMP